MYYQITAPPLAAAEKQAEELARLLRHSKQMTLQFVTVAGRYKAIRARLTLLTVPDRVAEQAARVMHILSERDDAARPNAAVRQREEWTLHAILVPTDPTAAPPDGGLLDGWDSVCLTVVYGGGRAVARLMCCVEDADRLAKLSVGGWRLTVRPGALTRMLAGGTWRGTPSFVPVPGGVAPAVPASAQSQGTAPLAEELPQTPLPEEAAAVLTDGDDGILLGVAPDGEAVRLVRRAMTLALIAPSEMRQTAVLALMRRGMQAGLGMVVAVERSLLPSEALAAWEMRVRLLDVQDVASSCAIPWHQIQGDLLAQAIAGPEAGERIGSPLPARFGAVLDGLGAGALRVPEVLGLVARPGDELRRVLAAGGVVVVPQDGDAASTVVARLLLAYLATPPPIGRAALLILDPALIPPDALRDQAIQVVLGERGDALVRMAATDAGWRLSGPGGAHLADMLPDLMAQPASGASALVDTIVREIGTPEPTAVSTLAAPPAEEAGWWAAGERGDDLHREDEPDPTTLEAAPAAEASAIQEAAPAAALPAVDLSVDGRVEVAAQPAPSVAEIAPMLELPAAEPLALDADTHTVVGDLDAVLGSLLAALMASEHADLTDQVIQSAVAGEAFGDADALAVVWAERAPFDPQPYCWRVVLAEDDAERAAAAEWAMRYAPDGPHAQLLRAVLDALGETALPSGGLAPSDLAGWPVWLDDEGGEHVPPPPASGWEALDDQSPPIAVHGHQNGVHAPSDLLASPAAGAEGPIAAEAVHGHQDAVHASLAAGADELIAAAPGGADLFVPAEAVHGHQDPVHALTEPLADLAAGVDEPVAAEAVHGHQDTVHASLAVGVDEPAAAAPGGTDLLVPAEAVHGRQDAVHALTDSLADLAAGVDEPVASEAVHGHQDAVHALSDLPIDRAAILATDPQAPMKAVHGHQDAVHAPSAAGVDEPASAAPGGANLLVPAEAVHGHQDAVHASNDLLADFAGGFDQSVTAEAVHGHQDAVHASPTDRADQPGVAALGGADLLAPAQAVHGHQDAVHALNGLLAPPTAGVDEPLAAEVVHGHQNAVHASPTAGADQPATAAPGGTELLVPAEAVHGHQNGVHATAESSARGAISPASPDVPPAAGELDDAAIRAAWLGGESVPELIARLTTAGVPAAIARARVRGAISNRPAAPLLSSAPAPLPALIVPQPAPADAMNGAPMPFMGATELDDEAIWQRWQAGEKTDDLVLVLCGRRGGAKADAARDRIYAVVVSRIVAELDASDLVERLLTSDDIPDDPRYPILMKRLARSEVLPTGALEQSLRKRLIAARQEV